MKSYKQTGYQLLKNTNYKKAYMFFYTYLSKWDDFNSGSFRSRKQTKKLLTYFSIKITWDHIQGWEPVTIVWSDFVYWFQLFIIKVWQLMDDSTFASRRAHWELSFDMYIYLHFTKNVTYALLVLTPWYLGFADVTRVHSVQVQTQRNPGKLKAKAYWMSQ